MNKCEKVADLRQFLARHSLPHTRSLLPLGVAAADQALGGGLIAGALHEVYAADWTAGGFAACLAILAAGSKPLFWVRPDYEPLEYGALYAQGLAELGGRADNLFLVRTANAAEALAAASDILACASVGALLLEISGSPKALDLVAGRRLNFIAGETGVTAILLREGAQQMPSAAQTRWHVTSACSDREDWGAPSFRAELVRNRLGPTGSFHLTWNPENGLFREPARRASNDSRQTNPGFVAATVFDRPAEEKRRIAF